jgi:hypothetical protein
MARWVSARHDSGDGADAAVGESEPKVQWTFDSGERLVGNKAGRYQGPGSAVRPSRWGQGPPIDDLLLAVGRRDLRDALQGKRRAGTVTQ